MDTDAAGLIALIGLTIGPLGFFLRKSTARHAGEHGGSFNQVSVQTQELIIAVGSGIMTAFGLVALIVVILR